MPPKIICDTMIWYGFGSGRFEKEKYKNENLTLTFINVHEVGTSFNLVNKIEEVRKAIQSMMSLPKYSIVEPPLIYLAQLANSDFKYDVVKEQELLLEWTKRIANGEKIPVDKQESFKEWLKTGETPLEVVANTINAMLDEIRAKIQDKKQHRSEDTSENNRKLISSWVSTTTEGKYNLDNLDWSKAELFEKTMIAFFSELEVSKMKFQPNDFLDMLNLVYVQPADKYFTIEKRWINLIEKAEMNKYLFKEK